MDEDGIFGIFDEDSLRKDGITLCGVCLFGSKYDHAY